MIVSGQLYCCLCEHSCASFKTTDRFLLLYFLFYIILYILTEFAKLLFYYFHNLCRHETLYRALIPCCLSCPGQYLRAIFCDSVFYPTFVESHLYQRLNQPLLCFPDKRPRRITSLGKYAFDAFQALCVGRVFDYTANAAHSRRNCS